MKTILVTGANGQLGSELQAISDTYSKQYQFLFTDKDELDITSLDAINEYMSKYAVNYIINCAAYTAVDKAEDDIDCCFLINKEAAINLAKMATIHNARMIQISTDYVFDGKGDKPYTEDDMPTPESVYGQSKWEGEKGVIQFCKEAIIIRTAWLYSSYGNNFVKTMIKLGNERNEINVVADQKGSPTNANDLAKAILQIVNHSEQNGLFQTGIYHYTNEGDTTWYDFAQAIHRFMKIEHCTIKPISTSEYPTRATRPQYSILSKEKIKSTYQLKIPEWDKSLQYCIETLL